MSPHPAGDEKKKTWESEPIANSDRKVFGKGKLWQHSLTLYAPAGSARAEAWSKQTKASLPAGKYLIRIHVDLQGRLERDWKAPLGKSELVGELEVDSRWPEGYASMTAVDASRLKQSTGPLFFQSRLVETKRVGDHRHRAQTHRRRSEHRAEQESEERV